MMVPAAKEALQQLSKSMRLMELPADRKWRVTAMGQAVFSSALPTRQGRGLYQGLDAVRKELCALDNGVLHLTFVLLGHTPGTVAIADWQQWGNHLNRLLREKVSLGDACARAVAEKVRGPRAANPIAQVAPRPRPSDSSGPDGGHHGTG